MAIKNECRLELEVELNLTIEETYGNGNKFVLEEAFNVGHAIGVRSAGKSSGSHAS